ncbi:hypothetical protein MMC20_001800 [Loxospora ochrophaea]|nr:hypothetical protein [Loxospora ochrophaea]
MWEYGTTVYNPIGTLVLILAQDYSTVERTTSTKSLLALKIRQKIYSFVIGDSELQILPIRSCAPSPSTQRCVRPPHPQKQYAWRWQSRQYRFVETEDKSPSCLGIESLMPRESFFRTCRQMYTESISMIYATSAFDTSILESFVSLKQASPFHEHAVSVMIKVKWSFSRSPFSSDIILKTDKTPWDHGTWVRFCEILSAGVPGLVALDLKMMARRQCLDMADAWAKTIPQLESKTSWIMVKEPAKSIEQWDEQTLRYRKNRGQATYENAPEFCFI